MITPQEEAVMAAYAAVEMAQRQLELFNNTYLHWWEGDEPVTHSERIAVDKIQRERRAHHEAVRDTQKTLMSCLKLWVSSKI